MDNSTRNDSTRGHLAKLLQQREQAQFADDAPHLAYIDQCIEETMAIMLLA